MSRPYSEQFLLSLTKTESRSIGVKLAKLCTEANLPTLYIANKLEVEPRSVYSWFRGGKIRNTRKDIVNNLIKEIERGLEVGTLPVHSLKEAKEYLNRMPM
jgi:hypothetical protein